MTGDHVADLGMIRLVYVWYMWADLLWEGRVPK
jgi:hypothetical protein